MQNIFKINHVLCCECGSILGASFNEIIESVYCGTCAGIRLQGEMLRVKTKDITAAHYDNLKIVQDVQYHLQFFRKFNSLEAAFNVRTQLLNYKLYFKQPTNLVE